MSFVSRRCVAGMQKIRKMENVHKKYQKQLLEEGTVKEDDLKKLQSHVSGIMSAEFEAARQYKPEVRSPLFLQLQETVNKF